MKLSFSLGRPVTLLALTVFVTSACQAQPATKTEQVPTEPATEVSLGPAIQTFMDELSATGATVTRGINKITQPFFSVAGIVLSIAGEDLQVYEYGDEAAAQIDAGNISTDASVINDEPWDWLVPPHFYLRANLIVFYFGDSATTLTLLEQILGPQFAGF